jgi:hypothetical protein
MCIFWADAALWSNFGSEFGASSHYQAVELKRYFYNCCSGTQIEWMRRASRCESGLVSFITNVRAATKLAGGSRNFDPALPFESNFRAITHPILSC